jgi:hypothetical protein
MKLDESIELINKQNISEMEKFKNIDVSEMRNYMSEMMGDDDMSSCLYEVLEQEGFLPNDLSEGEDQNSICEMMMGDDDVLSEMFKSCAGNESECGASMREWLDNRMGGEPGMESTDMLEIDDETSIEPTGDDYGDENVVVNVEKAVVYENGHYKRDYYELTFTDGFKVIMSLGDINGSVGVSSPEEVMGEPYELFSFLRDDNNDDEMTRSGSDINYDDEPIAESKLPAFKPVKGKNVDADNKNNSKKDGKTEVKDAEKSQKTVEQKTEEKINVKFSPDMESDFQKDVNQKQLGAFNALNLDYQNGVPDSYKKRVEMEVKTGLSRERDEEKFGKFGNVDYESTERVGNAIWDASQANQGERDDFYKPNPITVTKTPYEQTSISGKPKGGKKSPGGGDLTNENVNKDIERMKKMFGYDDNQIQENKKTDLSENDVLFKSISKKKFI